MKLSIKKILTIGKREVMSNIKRKQFLIATIIVPIVIIAFSVIGSMMMFDIKEIKVGYVDEFGVEIPNKVIENNLGKNTTIYFLKYENIEKGKEDVINEKINALIIIPKNYLDTGKIIIYSTTKSPNPLITETLNKLLIKKLLKGKVDNKTYERVINPMNLTIYSLSKKGFEKENFLSQLLPVGFVFLLYMAISSLSGIIVSSVIEEKQNRIMELLLCYSSAENLMFGKILGISIVGLVQIGIWVMVGIPLLLTYAVKISLYTITLAMAYFIMGYLFYSSLLCGLSSLFSHPKDASQLMSPIILIQLLPIMFMNTIMVNPNHYLAKILSYIPFTAPYTVVLRASSTNIPTTDIALSTTIMIISIIISFLLSIKLFKIGVLLYEENMNLKKVLKIIFKA
ncbi:ABC-2 type transporter [Methanocaldococcus vulcanius M7]|uniref:ABC-2 type transporter n=1 Tax=Methanocaldococcus vulcanius (strain ATCC 700851 / DSM 12094 / M7) TaxID=579137 RepID=C9RFX3_METVM|nr:ABC transporter permease [Methanocaldococcus vulcanius]ACX72475.1 ABC-2 type transporter [Methanocaldococcus vulcanius M7]